jgi:hypothetical protein
MNDIVTRCIFTILHNAYKRILRVTVLEQVFFFSNKLLATRQSFYVAGVRTCMPVTVSIFWVSDTH